MKHTTTYKVDLETLKLFLCKFKIYQNSMPENIIKKACKKICNTGTAYWILTKSWSILNQKKYILSE